MHTRVQKAVGGYLFVQGGAIIAFWALYWIVHTFRDLVTSSDRQQSFSALAAPDLMLAALSIAAAETWRRQWRVAQPLVLLQAGASMYATVLALSLWSSDPARWLVVVTMIPMGVCAALCGLIAWRSGARAA
ncbi:MAG: hypothetical protein U0573_14480 [Phycisphaerales bacterium]|nr:hypothetical protein [Planctomycetota bacterium]